MAAVSAASARALEHAAVEARYHNVDPVYAETRDIRLFGFVLFLLADSVLFGAFIFAYVYLRTSAPVWPPVVNGEQIHRLDLAFGGYNAMVLFASGVTMHYALTSWKQLKRGAFNAWVALTILLGFGFLAGQAHEYLSADFSYSGSAMGASFFTLTGLHGLHVFIGTILLTVLWIQANRGVYTESKYFGLTAGTLYWHFVDVIWVVLFSLFYLW
jgi:cytochrome c oxidase subunit III